MVDKKLIVSNFHKERAALEPQFSLQTLQRNRNEQIQK